MKEHILTKEEMDSKKALVDINLKVSEQVNLLHKLQEDETKFLVGRDGNRKKPLPQVVETKEVKTPVTDIEKVIIAGQMDSLKALSEVNIKISEGRNLLFKLQERETEYLIGREKKVRDRIQEVVDNSSELVKEADQNHAQIKELQIGVSEFVDKLSKAHEDFSSLLVEFEERNVEWERNIGIQQDDIQTIRNQLKIEKVQIENDKKNLDSIRIKLIKDQKKLNSDRGTIERAIKRLKEGRI